MGLTVRGVAGELRWGYHLAGTVGAWTVTKEPTHWTLSATVDQIDDFTVSQRPLKFVATHAQGAWKWPIDTLEIQGASLVGTLGPPET